MNKYAIIEIDKPENKKKLNIETLIIIIVLILVLASPFLNQKKELPNGTLMMRNILNGQIGIKLPNNEFTCFSKDNPFYKEMLIFFRNH